MNITATSPDGRRRQFLLIGVLAVAGAAYYFMSPDAPTGARPAASNQAAIRNAKAGPLPLPEAVKLAELKGESPEIEVGRNPFAFGVKPTPPPPPRIVLPPPVPVGPPPPPPGPTGPPPIPLKLAGILLVTPSGRPMATLKDPVTNGVSQVFEGDVVDGRYRVVRIGERSVVVSYLDGSGQRTIQIGN